MVQAVAKILMSSAFMGSMMYMARVQLNAAGRSDADEYIQKRMEPAAFAQGALSQIGACFFDGLYLSSYNRCYGW